MPRPTRKTVILNAESLQELLNNIWKESDEQRLKAIYQYNRQNRDLKDNTDIATIGKTNNELLKIIDGAIDKKIQVARLVNDHIIKSTTTGSGDSSPASTGHITEDAKDSIYDMIEKASKANNVEYVVDKAEEVKPPF